MVQDGIHPQILKDCAETLAKPLFLIFTESLSSGVALLDWKLGNISPIYKKGSRSVAGNYRPVSLTCIASKLMESCVKDAMLKHLLKNNLNTPHQHGFTKGHSFLTNLLETIQSWTEDVNQGDRIDVILLDFQKAFDKVSKKRLLQKLSTYGIRGKVLEWIADFLSDSKMRIMARSEYSEWFDVISGVPQGSVLGPILFLIYVNDIPETVNSNVKIFRTLKNKSDCKILQADLDNLSEWSNRWCLTFNTSKCKRMDIGKDNPKYVYTMTTENNIVLAETVQEKDLCVWISYNLKWEKQVVAQPNKLW